MNTPATRRVTARRALRIAGWSAAVLLAALAVFVLVSEAIGWRYLREPAERFATRAAGVPVVLGAPLRLSLLGRPQAELGRLTVGAAHELPVPHLVDAQQLRLSWRWADAWRAWRGGPLRARSIDAAVLHAHLLRQPDRRASWQLGRRDADRPPDADRGPPQVGSLTVGRGRITIDDDPLATKLQLRVQGGEGRAGAAAAGYAVQADGRWRGFPVKLQARAGATLPLLHDDSADAPAPAVPVKVDGHVGRAELHFDGQAGALLSARRIDGAIRIGGPSLAAFGDPLGVTLPQTPPFELEGRLRHDAGRWALQAERAAIGRSRLAGEFEYDQHGRPPRLSGQLRGTRLLLSDLGPAVGTGAPRADTGKVLPQRTFDLPSLRAMDADVKVAIDELDLGSSALAPLQSLRAHVVLAGGVLELNDIEAQVAGGRFSGSTRLDSRDRGAAWTAKLQVREMDVARWVRSLRPAAQPGDTPPPPYLTGQLALDAELAGEGRSTAQILGTLDGRLQGALRDGSLSHLATELAGADLAQALGVMLRGDEALPLRCARLDGNFDAGVMKIRRAVVDNRDSVVQAQGVVSLRDETLALRVTTKPKDFSPLSLRAPIIVAGAWTAPAVSIDAGRLAGRAVAAAALGALAAPAAALLPFLDFGSDDTPDPCADGAPRR